MNTQSNNKDVFLIALAGALPVVWLALLIAPYWNGSIFDLVSQLDAILADPMHILDPEIIKEASGDVQVIDLGDSDYVLLSEEDVEKEIEEQKKKDKQKEEGNDGEERQDD